MCKKQKMENDNEDEQCSICFGPINTQRMGKPNGCSHRFCYQCISRWAENYSYCPMDRVPFDTIETFENGCRVANSTINPEVYIYEHRLGDNAFHVQVFYSVEWQLEQVIRRYLDRDFEVIIDESPHQLPDYMESTFIVIT